MEDTRSKPLDNSMFARHPDPVLKEIGIQQFRQILHASFSVETYEHKEQRVHGFFFRLFRQGHYSVTFSKFGQYFPCLQVWSVRIPGSIWTMKSLAMLEALIFLNSVSVDNTRFVTKQLSYVRTTVTGMLIR